MKKISEKQLQALYTIEEAKKLSWICRNIQEGAKKYPDIQIIYDSFPFTDKQFEEEYDGLNVWEVCDMENYGYLLLFVLQIKSGGFTVMASMDEFGDTTWRIFDEEKTVHMNETFNTEESRELLANCYYFIYQHPEKFPLENILIAAKSIRNSYGRE